MSLTARSVSFAYGTIPVLNDVSLDVQPGRVTALFGPNGTGKSTLFRCILGLLPHFGEVMLGEQSTRGWSARTMSRHVGFVPQDHRVTFPYRVRDMVTMGASTRGGAFFGPSATDVSRALGNLDRLGLLPLADRSFAALSGGQRQLVLIARALTQDTPYLLFDEPTASLDFGNQNLIWHTIRDLAHTHGKGILVCSHDPNHVLWFCDDAIILTRDGTSMPAGPSRSVVTEPALRSLYPGEPTVTDADGIPLVLPGGLDRA